MCPKKNNQDKVMGNEKKIPENEMHRKKVDDKFNHILSGVSADVAEIIAEVEASDWKE
jgi:hypothetical protein